MARPLVVALRIVLGMVLAGSVFVQVVMVPLISADLAGSELDGVRVQIVAIVLLGIVAIQVAVVGVWRLLTMARKGTVFSYDAFASVDLVIGAITAASLLTFALGVVLAPGEAVAPGVVLLVGGLGVGIAGVALIVVVMRALLGQAVTRDADLRRLRAELSEVI